MREGHHQTELHFLDPKLPGTIFSFRNGIKLLEVGIKLLEVGIKLLETGFNPFTAPDCKISGMQDADTPTKSIFSTPKPSTSNAMCFDENPFRW